MNCCLGKELRVHVGNHSHWGFTVVQKTFSHSKPEQFREDIINSTQETEGELCCSLFRLSDRDEKIMTTPKKTLLEKNVELSWAEVQVNKMHTKKESSRRKKWVIGHTQKSGFRVQGRKWDISWKYPPLLSLSIWLTVSHPLLFCLVFSPVHKLFDASSVFGIVTQARIPHFVALCCTARLQKVLWHRCFNLWGHGG